MATQDLRRISSASISARRTTGMSRARAAASSGLSRFTAEDTTTTVASPILRALCPIEIGTPMPRSRVTLAFSPRSLPCTL
jgi:hypothetical protein